MNRDLDYVLNYMNKYCKDKYMQDSEPMLNHKDIEIVLKHIYDLQQENKQLKNILIEIEEWLKERQDYAYEYENVLNKIQELKEKYK